jgi:hypothetical protein
MNRSVGMERVFSLGDYKSIRFSDTINDLPQEVMLNQELIDKLRYLQMLNVDAAYQLYVDMNRRINRIPEEEKLSFLIEEKLNTLDDIKKLLFKE